MRGVAAVALAALAAAAGLVGLLAPSAAAASRFCDVLRADLSRGAGQGGLLVRHLDTGRDVCAADADKRRIIASNMKLFTTATALVGFGPDHRIATTVWRVGPVDHRGTLHGDLYIRGAGDPALAMPAYARMRRPRVATNFMVLRRQIMRSGIKRVTGHLIADDSIFDRLRGVPDSGWQTSQYIGPLSGLALNSGYTGPGARYFATDPAVMAAEKLARALRSSGIRVRRRVKVAEMPPGPRAGTGGRTGGGDAATPTRPRGRSPIARVLSPPMSLLAEQTNVHSDNFFAETILKLISAKVAGHGTTELGARIVAWFARAVGSGVKAVDGSGLSRGNMASPREVVDLLTAMIRRPIGSTFRATLPLSSRDGTLVDRMHDTPAERRCEAKTGTISGVSALSGYCTTRSGHEIAFSILMNSVWSYTKARAQQDIIAARIAGL